MILQLCLQHTKPGDFVVDIGVHRGQELFPMADHVGPNGHVWGFECNPDLVHLLSAKVQNEGRKNITLVEKGVYSHSTSLDFHNCPVNDYASSSFVQALVDVDIYSHIFKASNKKIITIETISLDEYFGEQKIDFIKCDAQGADPFVIKGGTNLITKNKPIMLYEWEHGTADELGIETFHLLKGIGYKLYRYATGNSGRVSEINKEEDMFIASHGSFDLFCYPV